MDTPAASTGTATPIELNPEEAAQSLKVSLADLSAKATALYVHKNYEDAAELFARAAEMQAEMNGEMSPENAEILFLYGRALFRVGQSKSDVLGGKAPEKKQSKPKASNGGSSKKNGVEKAEAKVEKAASSAAAEASTKKEEEAVEAKKPLFHFEGDENFVDSEDEVEEEVEGEEEEEDDDLGTAFEILDLARVLLEKKLEGAQAEEEAQQGKGKQAESDEGVSPKVRHIKERLADTHDLLAEISLENERYPNAITDSRASLKYKQELYPFESEIIAEAHFKLSLALEFASVTKASEDDSAANQGNSEIDQSLRDEAAAELAKAIESTKQKLQAQEVELAAVHNPEDNELSRQEIVNIKEILAEMEQRLVELRKPPLDINQALGLPSRGEEPALKPVSEEVKNAANDLSGLVRKKRKAEDEPPKEDAKRAKSEEKSTATEVATEKTN
ncbi:hypothetical protein QBC43DRAFT_341888 [Cladorrhinum sp. PSN259]|nr:hypothetical protein QBC43DRAFT_341888 [Cladorrhinum sp. PSN259]